MEQAKSGAWICTHCASGYRPRTGTSTYHLGECDYCKGVEVAVTAARDYGYPPLPKAKP
jgi:hypothetical protein